MRPRGDLVVVASYPDAVKAHLAKGRLETEGIPATVGDEHYVSLDWMMSNALGGVKVLVEASRFEQALGIVTDLEAGLFELGAPGLDVGAEEAEPLWAEPLRCPRCREASVEAGSSNSWRIALLGVHLFQLPLPFTRTRYRCRCCGYDFRA